MIELLSNRAPWMATTAGERLLFLLLDRHDEWRILAETLQVASLLMGRRYGDLTNFFVGASVLRLQQRLLRLAHDIREEFALDREQQTKAASTPPRSSPLRMRQPPRFPRSDAAPSMLETSWGW